MNQNGYTTKPIVIVGCQRSGTTLLRTILGRHPQLLEHPSEPQYILELYQRFGYIVRDVDTAVAYLLKHPYLPDTITGEMLQHAFATHKLLSLYDFCQKFLHVWAGELLLTRRPILKHPALIYHLDLVATLFPQAIIIHVVRDPRANIASQITRWAHYSVYETAMLWKSALKSIEQYTGQPNALPVLEVCYEKLLLEPEQEVSSLCQQLGIAFLPGMLAFEEETFEFLPDAPPRRITFHSVESSRLNQWQTRLSPLDVRLIEHLCQQEMHIRGYVSTNPLVPPQQFTKELWYERIHYYYKINGRRLKNLIRKINWRLGFGILNVPPDKYY